MCYRFYYDLFYGNKLDELIEEEGVETAGRISEAVSREAAKDVFPSNASTVICGREDGLVATSMNWGFTNPYKKGLVANARSETAMEKNMFRDSIMNRRCVIPASGFYEWDPFKARFRFTTPDEGLILLAGFYRDEQGAKRYTILTTDANESMRLIHDRMPVMIRRSEIRLWIRDDDSFSEFLRRPQMQLVCEQDSGQIRMEFGI